jgi:hypothetical protein
MPATDKKFVYYSVMSEITPQYDAISRIREETLANGTIKTLSDTIRTDKLDVDGDAILAGVVHYRREAIDVPFDSPDDQRTIGYFACKVVCVDPNASEFFFAGAQGLQDATVINTRFVYSPPLDNYAHKVERETTYRFRAHDTQHLDSIVETAIAEQASTKNTLLPNIQCLPMKMVPRALREEERDVEMATFYRTLENNPFMEALAVEMPFNETRIPSLADWFVQK